MIEIPKNLLDTSSESSEYETASLSNSSDQAFPFAQLARVNLFDFFQVCFQITLSHSYRTKPFENSLDRSIPPENCESNHLNHSDPKGEENHLDNRSPTSDPRRINDASNEADGEKKSTKKRLLLDPLKTSLYILDRKPKQSHDAYANSISKRQQEEKPLANPHHAFSWCHFGTNKLFHSSTTSISGEDVGSLLFEIIREVFILDNCPASLLPTALSLLSNSTQSPFDRKLCSPTRGLNGSTHSINSIANLIEQDNSPSKCSVENSSNGKPISQINGDKIQNLFKLKTHSSDIIPNSENIYDAIAKRGTLFTGSPDTASTTPPVGANAAKMNPDEMKKLCERMAVELPTLLEDLLQYAVLVAPTSEELNENSSGSQDLECGSRSISKIQKAPIVGYACSNSNYFSDTQLLYMKYPPPLFRQSSFSTHTSRLLNWLKTWTEDDIMAVSPVNISKGKKETNGTVKKARVESSDKSENTRQKLDKTEAARKAKQASSKANHETSISVSSLTSSFLSANPSNSRKGKISIDSKASSPHTSSSAATAYLLVSDDEHAVSFDKNETAKSQGKSISLRKRIRSRNAVINPLVEESALKLYRSEEKNPGQSNSGNLAAAAIHDETVIVSQNTVDSDVEIQSGNRKNVSCANHVMESKSEPMESNEIVDSIVEKSDLTNRCVGDSHMMVLPQSVGKKYTDACFSELKKKIEKYFLLWSELSRLPTVISKRNVKSFLQHSSFYSSVRWMLKSNRIDESNPFSHYSIFHRLKKQDKGDTTVAASASKSPSRFCKSLPFFAEMAKEAEERSIGFGSLTENVYYDRYGNRLRSARLAKKDAEKREKKLVRERKMANRKGYFGKGSMSDSMSGDPDSRYLFTGGMNSIYATPSWNQMPNSFSLLDLQLKDSEKECKMDGGHFSIMNDWASSASDSSMMHLVNQSSPTHATSPSTTKRKRGFSRFLKSTSPDRISDSSIDESSSSSSSEESTTDKDGVTNIAVLHGPTGVGKTAAVYLVADILNYNVVEVNSSLNRSPSSIEKLFAELTRSKSLKGFGTVCGLEGAENIKFVSIREEFERLKQKQVESLSHDGQADKKGSPCSPLSSSANKLSQRFKKNAISAEAVAAFFKPRGAKREPLPEEAINQDSTSPTEGDEKASVPVPIEHNNKDPQIEGTPNSNPNDISNSSLMTNSQSTPKAIKGILKSNTIILFEDVDILLGDETTKSFYSTIKALADKSKIPIVVTVSSPPSTKRQYPFAQSELCHKSADNLDFFHRQNLSLLRHPALIRLLESSNMEHAENIGTLTKMATPSVIGDLSTVRPGAAPSAPNCQYVPLNASLVSAYFGEHTPFASVQPITRCMLFAELLIIAAVERGILSRSLAQRNSSKKTAARSLSTLQVIESEFFNSSAPKDTTHRSREVDVIALSSAEAFCSIAKALQSEIFGSSVGNKSLPSFSPEHNSVTHAKKNAGEACDSNPTAATTDIKYWLCRLQYLLLSKNWPHETTLLESNDKETKRVDCANGNLSRMSSESSHNLFSRIFSSHTPETASLWDSIYGRFLTVASRTRQSSPEYLFWEAETQNYETEFTETESPTGASYKQLSVIFSRKAKEDKEQTAIESKSNTASPLSSPRSSGHFRFSLDSFRSAEKEKNSQQFWCNGMVVQPSLDLFFREKFGNEREDCTTFDLESLIDTAWNNTGLIREECFKEIWRRKKQKPECLKNNITGRGAKSYEDLVGYASILSSNPSDIR